MRKFRRNNYYEKLQNETNLMRRDEKEERSKPEK